jgi:L-alanine-DL-glutamate epimerase-like enolase superfamily enzyme
LPRPPAGSVLAWLAMKEELFAEVRTLHLREPFRIAHGATSSRQVLRVRLGAAWGEAPFVPYYQESPAAVLDWIRTWRAARGEGSPLMEAAAALAAAGRGESFEWGRFAQAVPADAPRVARLALTSCLADAAGKSADQPFWKLVGLDPAQAPPACRSVGIPTDLEAYRRQVAALARQFPVIKLKLGSGDLSFDREIVATARAAAPLTEIFADANCGWSPEQAARIIPELPAWRIACVEQPVGRDVSLEPWRELRARLPRCPLPLVADESAQTAVDVERLRGLADGVNVKLVKAGGLDRAYEMMLAARAAGMSVLLGCMIESSLGVTAAAQLAPLADRLDLDGHLYLDEDDWSGVSFDSTGRLVLPDRPGLGCRPVEWPEQTAASPSA